MQITSQFTRDAASISKHDQLTRQAQLFVSQTFFGTMLKQMRESPFRSELFDGGRGGKAFGSLLDQHLAERMSRGAAAPLVRSIVRRFERLSSGGESQQKLKHAVKNHVAPTVRS